MSRILSKTHRKFLSKLLVKKYRAEQSLFLISGQRAVSEAIKLASAGSIRELIIQHNKQILLDNPPYTQLKNVPVYLCDEMDFSAISDEQHPQGVALVMQLPTYDSPLKTDIEGTAFYLHQVNDPGNLGTIIRSAAWFNIHDIYLSPGSTDAYQPKCVRATAGAILNVRIWEDTTAEMLLRLREKGYNLLASDVMEGTVLSKLDTKKPRLILMGSEAHGLPPDIIRLAQDKLHIPGSGNGESLNLATATAIIMYHFKAQG